MPVERKAHMPGRFKLEIQELHVGGFAEASMVDVEAGGAYRPGATTPVVRRPGMDGGGTLTLKRGLALDAVMREWQQNNATGQQDRRTISLILLDEQGGETMRWTMFDCWPARYIALDGSVEPGENVVEELEIRFEHKNCEL
jgi:phage tail-like protein